MANYETINSMGKVEICWQDDISLDHSLHYKANILDSLTGWNIDKEKAMKHTSVYYSLFFISRKWNPKTDSVCNWPGSWDKMVFNSVFKDSFLGNKTGSKKQWKPQTYSSWKVINRCRIQRNTGKIKDMSAIYLLYITWYSVCTMCVNNILFRLWVISRFHNGIVTVTRALQQTLLCDCKMPNILWDITK